MNRLRLADVREPLARVANWCASDARIPALANESHRRLVAKGRWLGTTQRYRICTNASGCLVWPRQIETIEAYWLCDGVGTVRNGWYETSPGGPGLMDSEGGPSTTLIDRGTAATFDEIDNLTSRVMVQAEVTELATARLLLRGYDEAGNWVRTQEGGEWIDGEWVGIGTAPHFTVGLWTKVTEVVKDVTNGPVRLWQYDTALGMETKQLAYYEADETLPIYRVSLVPGLGVRNGCGDGDCESNQITVVAKLNHVDVRVDNDFFLLGNLAAVKLMAMAVLKEEKNLFEESMAYEAKAVKALQDELGSYEGDGAVPVVKQEGSQTWGAGVMNTVGELWR